VAYLTFLKKGTRKFANYNRETYLTVPKIRNRKTVFVSEDVRDELDAVVRRLGGRGMSVSGLLENLAREHLAAYRGDIEQWRKI